MSVIPKTVLKGLQMLLNASYMGTIIYDLLEEFTSLHAGQVKCLVSQQKPKSVGADHLVNYITLQPIPFSNPHSNRNNNILSALCRMLQS